MTFDDVSFRAARREDAEAVFNVTKASIDGLARASYSRNQIQNWMGYVRRLFTKSSSPRGE
ncbi:hypothetical protein ABIA96_006559 [Bradyrhizobium sp. LB11.1]